MRTSSKVEIFDMITKFEIDNKNADDIRKWFRKKTKPEKSTENKLATDSLTHLRNYDSNVFFERQAFEKKLASDKKLLVFMEDNKKKKKLLKINNMQIRENSARIQKIHPLQHRCWFFLETRTNCVINYN